MHNERLFFQIGLPRSGFGIEKMFEKYETGASRHCRRVPRRRKDDHYFFGGQNFRVGKSASIHILSEASQHRDLPSSVSIIDLLFFVEKKKSGQKKQSNFTFYFSMLVAVFGKASLLEKDPNWFALIEYCKQNQAYIEGKDIIQIL